MVDNIIQGKDRTFREFGSYYTESDPILTYMVDRLGVESGDKILEPCAGDGVFIEKITSGSEEDFKIHAVDLNPKAISSLRESFNDDRISIEQADTLLDFSPTLFGKNTGLYNKIIGNPPYGAWQNLEKRKLLKDIYGGYVKETYTLFIRKCIDLLEEDGRLVFIVPDTFLALNMHVGTRKQILTDTKIEEILLIPSNFFPGVNFGYSNLCIISLVKSSKAKENLMKIVSVNDTPDSLYEVTKRNYSVAHYHQDIKQSEILNTEGHTFLLGINDSVRDLVRNTTTQLGDIAQCVTGFYSGDNKKRITALAETVKGAKDYPVVRKEEVENNSNEFKTLDGLVNGKRYIPYLKNATDTFIKPTEWFLEWDKETVSMYKRDKKARFQNSEFYFKKGIGVPMVKSRKVHAVLLEERLFDQSVVGVFPKDDRHLNYLLAFLNSKVCAVLLNAINHTANNSANYLKKLPVILDNEAIEVSEKIMSDFYETKDKEKALFKIDELFDSLYKLEAV